MKTSLTLVPTLKVTVTLADPTRLGQSKTISRVFRKASKAAQFYAMNKNHEWWEKIGHKNPNPDRYEIMGLRYARLRDRALPVFQ